MRTAASDRTDGHQDRESPETWRREQQAARSLSVHKSEAGGERRSITYAGHLRHLSLLMCLCRANARHVLLYLLYSCQSLIILCSVSTLQHHHWTSYFSHVFKCPPFFHHSDLAVQQQHHVSALVPSWVKQTVKVLLRPFSPQCINAAVITEQSNVLHIYQEAIIKTQSDTFIMSLY